MTLVALFLWLTQSRNRIKKPSDIPDFIRISGANPCKQNAFRTYHDGSLSWTEYAHHYESAHQELYLWQPIPIYFNDYFQRVISAIGYETAFLRPKLKVRLFNIMSKKWATPAPLQSYPRARKDTFLRYFIDCALIDNTLTAIARAEIVPQNQRHHKMADHYQSSDSDRIRYKLFDAHNRYLSRLIRAARNAKLSPYFELFHNDYTINLINEHPNVANYLSEKGRITQTVLDTSNRSQQSIRSPATKLGSKRHLDELDVVRFFSQLDDEVRAKKPKRSADKTQWISYYCLATYRLALLFIVLTGTRPTHSISILKPYYGEGDMVFIYDKGRLRQVIVCDYLQREIHLYKKLQVEALKILGVEQTPQQLWFGIDEHRQPFCLSNKILRQFMHQYWPGIVPYQLRHFFAQSAINHMNSTRLYDQNIDRLMGHACLGEHLGSDQIFPHTFRSMMAYLNDYVSRLGFKEMAYD